MFIGDKVIFDSFGAEDGSGENRGCLFQHHE